MGRIECEVVEPVSVVADYENMVGRLIPLLERPSLPEAFSSSGSSKAPLAQLVPKNLLCAVLGSSSREDKSAHHCIGSPH